MASRINRIKTIKDENYEDGTVLEQSIVGTRVKDLLSGKTKLVIIIVNNKYFFIVSIVFLSIIKNEY